MFDPSPFQYRDSSDILKTQNGFEYDSFSITQIKGSFKVLTGDVRRVPKLRPTTDTRTYLIKNDRHRPRYFNEIWVDIVIMYISTNKPHRI